jgi:hypothetical protein
MQKFDMHKPGENKTMVAVIVVFFTVLVLFSYWFTQS